MPPLEWQCYTQKRKITSSTFLKTFEKIDFYLIVIKLSSKIQIYEKLLINIVKTVNVCYLNVLKMSLEILNIIQRLTNESYK